MNALPEEGSGGGSGGSMETCTVIISARAYWGGSGFIPEGIFDVLLEDGSVGIALVSETPQTDDGGSTGTEYTVTYTVENVIKGSKVVLINTTTDWEFETTTSGEITQLAADAFYGAATVFSYRINGDGQISIT